MDKIEQFLEEELGSPTNPPEFDLDEFLSGTHGRIKRRSQRRKLLFSTPIVALLIMMVYIVLPGNGSDQLSPGGELLMAGWESSWTESEVLDETLDSDALYDLTVDYIFNNSYYSYSDEANEFLDDLDLEDLLGYMKEA